MNALRKALPLLILAAIVVLPGCGKDEKRYAGESEGEFRLSYQLQLNRADQERAAYLLHIQPKDRQFFEQIQNRWHEESKLKMAAYQKMKAFCETTPVESLCNSLSEMGKDLESGTVKIPYSIHFYDHKQAEIASINFMAEFNAEETDSSSSKSLVGNLQLNDAQFQEIGSARMSAAVAQGI